MNSKNDKGQVVVCVENMGYMVALGLCMVGTSVATGWLFFTVMSVAWLSLNVVVLWAAKKGW